MWFIYTYILHIFAFNGVPCLLNLPQTFLLVGEDKSHAAIPKEKVEKVQSLTDPLAEATNVEKLVNEIINKTSKTFLSEVNKVIRQFHVVFFV